MPEGSLEVKLWKILATLDEPKIGVGCDWGAWAAV